VLFFLRVGFPREREREREREFSEPPCRSCCRGIFVFRLFVLFAAFLLLLFSKSLFQIFLEALWFLCCCFFGGFWFCLWLIFGLTAPVLGHNFELRRGNLISVDACPSHVHVCMHVQLCVFMLKLCWGFVSCGMHFGVLKILLMLLPCS
jgi:hypothetical protein